MSAATVDVAVDAAPASVATGAAPASPGALRYEPDATGTVVRVFAEGAQVGVIVRAGGSAAGAVWVSLVGPAAAGGPVDGVEVDGKAARKALEPVVRAGLARRAEAHRVMRDVHAALSVVTHTAGLGPLDG